MFVCKEPYAVCTVLGSCVATILIDKVNRVSAINHYIMPYWNGEGLSSPKYGNIAIKKLIKRVVDRGARVENIRAKIFGGASMYYSRTDGKLTDIGTRNIVLAYETLAEYHIPVVSSDTGGINGRRLIFYTNTGIVKVKSIKNTIRGDA